MPLAVSIFQTREAFLALRLALPHTAAASVETNGAFYHTKTAPPATIGEACATKTGNRSRRRGPGRQRHGGAVSVASGGGIEGGENGVGTLTLTSLAYSGSGTFLTNGYANYPASGGVAPLNVSGSTA